MTEEHFDILDDKGELTGEIRSKSDAHGKGLIHRTAHVWLLNPKKELLLQKRSLNKTAYPGLWDISAAGHISAGQTSLEAAKRETEEELGLSLPDSTFKYLFTVEEHIILNNGTYINNEFQDVYLVHLETEPQKLNLQHEEVDEARWIPIGEFKSWVSGKGEPVVPHEEEYRKLLEFLSQ